MGCVVQASPRTAAELRKCCLGRHGLWDGRVRGKVCADSDHQELWHAGVSIALCESENS